MEDIKRKAHETVQKDVPVGTDLMIYSEVNGVRVYMDWTTWLAYLNTLTAANAAVVLNTAKVGITPTQAAEIVANTAKLAGIEANAKDDQTGAEIKTLYEGEANTNGYTDAEKTKLASIDAAHYLAPLQSTAALTALTEASLTDKARVYVEDETSDYFYNATAGSGDLAPDDQTSGTGFWKKVAVGGETAASIKTKYESNADTNGLTDALLAKLNAIEASATADQSDAEIETAYNNQVSLVSQGEAEAGVATTKRTWTAERVAQAIAALGGIDLLKEWVSRSVEDSQWVAMTYGKGLFVAVASSGTNRVMTSPDGITWTARSAAENNNWFGVAYDNGLFVAVASNGTNRVMTSPDGITWTARSAAEANEWKAITVGEALFVAVSESGTNRVMTSPDGITWTARSAAEANEWSAVTHASGLFVAVATTGTNRVMTSHDGITWTARSAAEASSWRGVISGNDLFVAVSQDGTNRVMTSPDGITWTARSAAEANAWIGITYANGLFVAVASSGTNRVMISIDGIKWTARSATEAINWNSVVYGKGLFVAASNIGTNRVMTAQFTDPFAQYILKAAAVLEGAMDADGYGMNDVGELTSSETDDGNSAAADTIDWSAKNFHKSTLTGNCTYTFTAPSGATTLVLKVVQDATGSRIVTWPATVKWSGGAAPTLSTAASAVDIISFYFDGTNYYGFISPNHS